ncbi:class I SAM-dependent methyltransferase [Actinocrinis puniceicyclus]|uniref:Class I SAM-dependent methyltransferase n=1 Tax=Actinocrinis puniceicyclus TaxID=977794 RepID=A0A8J8BER1_9ACTN|nr:class I SAM-dependent methyltransferase [Actinocrinis puniceicyclus]MBS2965421.1 class I SAM-dependent methyltransferase [Actinocrinis puniceicyclus]
MSEQSPKISATAAAAASGFVPAAADRRPSMDRLAPLAPNAWLRFDLVRRMIPEGVTDVLEIGCGMGSVGVRLAARYRYLGLEPSPESFAVATARIALGGRGEVRNEVADALDPAERFDLVCAFEVLEHIEDDTAALESWARRVRPGGWLLLSVPARQGRYGAHDVLAGHFRRYERAQLAALLEKAGFTQIEAREYGMPLGYLLESARNAVGKRKLAAAPQESMEQRTGASARLLQPRGLLYGGVARFGTAPFRYVQRGFPRAGTGLVVRARLAG